MEQRWERCSQHPPRGPIWDYPAAASDACASVASILFCCCTAPEGEAHWSPAAVEAEEWAGVFWPLPSLQTLLCLAPFLLKPPRRVPSGGLCCTPAPSAPGLGRRHLHLFLTSPGNAILHPWTGWESESGLDQPLVSSIRATRPRILLFPS